MTVLDALKDQDAVFSQRGLVGSLRQVLAWYESSGCPGYW